MKTEYRYMDIPTAEAHRIAIRVQRHTPAEGGDAKLVLQRQRSGPFWTDLDSRDFKAYAKAQPRARREWIAEMEHELFSEWFVQEIADLRN